MTSCQTKRLTAESLRREKIRKSWWIFSFFFCMVETYHVQDVQLLIHYARPKNVEIKINKKRKQQQKRKNYNENGLYSIRRRGTVTSSGKKEGIKRERKRLWVFFFVLSLSVCVLANRLICGQIPCIVLLRPRFHSIYNIHLFGS